MIPAGTEVLVYFGGGAISAQTNADENWNMGNRNTSTKQTGTMEESAPTRMNGDLSLTFLFDDNATISYVELFNDMKQKNIKELKVSTQNSGDYELVVQAYPESLGRGYPDQDNQECTVSFKFTGDANYNQIP